MLVVFWKLPVRFVSICSAFHRSTCDAAFVVDLRRNVSDSEVDNISRVDKSSKGGHTMKQT